MAYSNPLDPTTPSSTALRSEGDDRIRETKAALIERLQTVFANLSVDPLQFIAGIIPTAALADAAVAVAKIADAAVTTPKLADGATTTPKIADGGVTNAKVADDTLLAVKTKDGSTVTRLLGEVAGSYTAVGGGLVVNGNTINEVDVNVTGVLVGSMVVVTYRGVPDIGISWSAFPNGTGIIRIRIRNHTGTPITIAAGAGFEVMLLKPVG